MPRVTALQQAQNAIGALNGHVNGEGHLQLRESGKRYALIVADEAGAEMLRLAYGTAMEMAKVTSAMLYSRGYIAENRPEAWLEYSLRSE